MFSEIHTLVTDNLQKSIKKMDTTAKHAKTLDEKLAIRQAQMELRNYRLALLQMTFEIEDKAKQIRLT